MQRAGCRVAAAQAIHAEGFELAVCVCESLSECSYTTFENPKLDEATLCCIPEPDHRLIYVA